MPGLRKQIIDLLAPAIGDALAEAKLATALNVAGVKEVDPDNIDLVAKKLYIAIVRATGPAVAEEIEKKIKALA